MNWQASWRREVAVAAKQVACQPDAGTLILGDCDMSFHPDRRHIPGWWGLKPPTYAAGWLRIAEGGLFLQRGDLIRGEEEYPWTRVRRIVVRLSFGKVHVNIWTGRWWWIAFRPDEGASALPRLLGALPAGTQVRIDPRVSVDVAPGDPRTLAEVREDATLRAYCLVPALALVTIVLVVILALVLWGIGHVR